MFATGGTIQSPALANVSVTPLPAGEPMRIEGLEITALPVGYLVVLPVTAWILVWQQRAEKALLNVSYDPTRELWRDVNRAFREQYEREVVHRDERSRFWAGLSARWDKALMIAERFPKADINAILDAIGTDTRIGKKYLGAGLSYGGPCFPRDNR